VADTVTASDVREALDGALSIAKDDSFTQLERIELLLERLDSVYALFGCGRAN
jgi:hypothetical protein